MATITVKSLNRVPYALINIEDVSVLKYGEAEKVTIKEFKFDDSRIIKGAWCLYRGGENQVTGSTIQKIVANEYEVVVSAEFDQYNDTLNSGELLREVAKNYYYLVVYKDLTDKYDLLDIPVKLISTGQRDLRERETRVLTFKPDAKTAQEVKIINESL